MRQDILASQQPTFVYATLIIGKALLKILIPNLVNATSYNLIQLTTREIGKKSY